MSDYQNAVTYKCPNCAADLKFSVETQGFKCDYCLSEFTEAEMKELISQKQEQQADQSAEEQALNDEFEKTGVYVCKSCGAEVMADENTSATFCFYCHNPVIMSGRVEGEYRPAAVLPFQISREKALDTFADFCKKHKFLPKDFREAARSEKVVGLYVPFWVTDCKVSADMEALGKKTRSWSSGDYRYTETSEFAVERRGTVRLQGLPADGASHIDDELMEACEPFDYSLAKPFSMEYLSGFLAEKYDVDKQGVFPRIQKRAVQATDQIVRSSMTGYDSVSVTHADLRVQQTDWKYMLLPVWFLSYKYGDKVYEFAVNGQSGKFVGVPPLDKKKCMLVSLAVGIVCAIVAGLVVLSL